MHSTRGRSMDTAVGEALAAALQQGAAAVVGDSASGAAAVLHPDFGTAADVCAKLLVPYRKPMARALLRPVSSK